MERANAELLEGKSTSSLATPMSSGKRELSRFNLIQQARDGAQTFWTPYEFHTSTPELSFGPLRVELNVDQSKFTDFNADSMRNLFNECLKNTCLIDDISVAHLDLIMPEEVYIASDGCLDPLDEPLLTNDVNPQHAENHEDIYTGHFLRKPQLMSNDLFTEGSRTMGSSSNRFSIPTGQSGIDSDEFSTVRELDEKFRGGESLFNSISKKPMKAKRVLRVLPGKTSGNLCQIKLDEMMFNGGRLNVVMDKHFQSYEQVAELSAAENLSYAKRRKFVQINKGTLDNNSEEYFVMTIPKEDTDRCFLFPVSHKILLKKDVNAWLSEGSLRLTIADSDM